MTILGIAFDFDSLCTSTRREVPDESRSNWHGLRRPPEVPRSDHSMCESFTLSQWTWAAGYAEMEREGLQNLTSKLQKATLRGVGVAAPLRLVVGPKPDRDHRYVTDWRLFTRTRWSKDFRPSVRMDGFSALLWLFFVKQRHSGKSFSILQVGELEIHRHDHMGGRLSQLALNGVLILKRWLVEHRSGERENMVRVFQVTTSRPLRDGVAHGLSFSLPPPPEGVELCIAAQEPWAKQFHRRGAGLMLTCGAGRSHWYRKDVFGKEESIGACVVIWSRAFSTWCGIVLTHLNWLNGARHGQSTGQKRDLRRVVPLRPKPLLGDALRIQARDVIEWITPLFI